MRATPSSRGTRRLAIQINGVTRIFDTGDHRIGGVQQQQGGGYGSVGFTSQFGTFAVSALSELGAQQVAATPVTAPAPQHQGQHQSATAAPQPSTPPTASAPAPVPGGAGDPATIVAAIESLAGLHQRGILSDEEFSAKKAELLARL